MSVTSIVLHFFFNLSNAFDTVDHNILKQRIFYIVLLEQAVAWFSNYLSGKSQCIKYDRLCPDILSVRVYPRVQCLVHFCPLFIYIIWKIMCQMLILIFIRITLSYVVAVLTLVQAIEKQQVAFNVVQNSLIQLKLGLYAKKTKLMFTN